MADFASALYARLKADVDIAAVVGTRIYWVNRPQNSALPAIRLQTVSDPRDEHLKGYNDMRVTRVQADCFASTYGASRQLAEKVVNALSTPGTFGGVQFGRIKAQGPQDLGEDTSSGFVYRASLDLLVAHKLV